ncbi:MAG: hypothetical protein VW683_01430 [Betaproteobacteria bacterium]|jgi:hypothetical protein
MRIYKLMDLMPEALDPVGKEDDDVDNDGDSDSSDDYLKKRRAAVSKAMKEEEDPAAGNLTNRTNQLPDNINPNGIGK